MTTMIFCASALDVALADLLLMPCLQLRNNRANNRSGRTQIEHDIMEGLPVRQWKKSIGTVNLAPPREDLSSARQNGIWKELPMPRGSELYSPMSQALLRAARMPQMHKPPAPLLEEDKELGEEEDAEGEPDTTLIVNKWSLVPRNMEEPELEYLAKRRKGLPPVYGGLSNVSGQTPTMRQIKVRRVDADGNAHVWDVMAPEGTAIEGEILENEAIRTQAAAPGTVVEGMGIANAEGVVVMGETAQPTPTRRKPPPPKRKHKSGPGRGRKKKMVPALGTENLMGTPNIVAPVNGEGLPTNVRAAEDDAATTGEVGDQDILMGDDSLLQDGEEVSSSDDEDGEEGDREEGEILSSPDLDAPISRLDSPPKPPLSRPPIIRLPSSLSEESRLSSAKVPTKNTTRDASSSPDIALAAKSLPIPDKGVQPVLEAIESPAPLQEEALKADGIEVAHSDTLVNGGSKPPEDHNPLDNLIEPQTAALNVIPQDVANEDEGFALGEDLFGSLEKQLDDKS